MFDKIKEAVVNQFKTFDKSKLFVADVPKGVLFDAYLAALPEDEKQPHNCSCCRSFLNRYGNLISIVEGKIVTLWDFEIEGLYADVPKSLGALVQTAAIRYPFLATDPSLGTDHNFGEKDGKSIKYIHFALRYPATKTVNGSDIGKIRGEQVSGRGVFKRGLETISFAACNTVLSLIESNSLNRGGQYKEAVEKFVGLKSQYDLLTADDKEIFAWEHASASGRIRNSMIGSLLVDLSEGRSQKSAIASYEEKARAENYMHSSAPASKGQSVQARRFFEDNGYVDSLERRHATRDDIPLDVLLYVDRDRVKKSAFDLVDDEIKVDPKSFARAPKIELSAFLANVLPTAETFELFVDSDQNVVSLIAPVHPEANSLFSWNNNISWTYRNNLTDSVSQKVRDKGGNADDIRLRISLEWYNFDDLDLHVIEPTGNEIWFRNPRSTTGGFLDIDENRSPNTRTPVENIAWSKSSKPKQGAYRVGVNSWAQRENQDVGFMAQITDGVKTYNYKYDRKVIENQTVDAATFEYSHEHGIINPASSLRLVQNDVDNAGTFQRVDMLMFSPNYWESNLGNKHMFFILKGMKTETELMPFFNEYLKPEMREHRKYIESLITKLMVQPTEDQLTGIGFSLTRQRNIIVKVNNRVMQVTI